MGNVVGGRGGVREVEWQGEVIPLAVDTNKTFKRWTAEAKHDALAVDQLRVTESLWKPHPELAKWLKEDVEKRAKKKLKGMLKENIMLPDKDYKTLSTPDEFSGWVTGNFNCVDLAVTMARAQAPMHTAVRSLVRKDKYLPAHDRVGRTPNQEIGGLMFDVNASWPPEEEGELQTGGWRPKMSWPDAAVHAHRRKTFIDLYKQWWALHEFEVAPAADPDATVAISFYYNEATKKVQDYHAVVREGRVGGRWFSKWGATEISIFKADVPPNDLRHYEHIAFLKFTGKQTTKIMVMDGYSSDEEVFGGALDLVEEDHPVLVERRRLLADRAKLKDQFRRIKRLMDEAERVLRR